MKVYFSVPRNSREVIPAVVAGALRDIGFTGAVLELAWTGVNPEYGVWDWHPLDDCITNLHRGGISEIILSQPQWTPAHATMDGKITYLPYTQGCSPWIVDEHGNTTGKNAFNPSLPWAVEPAHLNPAAVEDMAYRAAMRYVTNPLNTGRAAVVSGFGCGNEPDIGDYWPAVATKPLDEAFDRWWNEWARPFRRGITAARKAASWFGDSQSTLYDIYGPGTATEDGFRRVLELNRPESQFDRIAFHGYADDPAESLARAKEIVQERVERYKSSLITGIPNTPQLYITEVGDGGHQWIGDYIRYCRERGDIALVCWGAAISRCVIVESDTSARLSDEGMAIKEALRL